ncbi:trimeric intracellular cation channel family protein [Sinimarinibacterium sp. CAU 1509]|nr:trimeric intracellular cation channel family protein [Sinimarinibacterium sp. CAU 1509]
MSLLMYLLSQIAVASCAAAAVLEAGKKRYDPFGMIVVATSAALGGGSIRDMLLGRPVFWVHDATYLGTTIVAALATFGLARLAKLPAKLFLLPDAMGLALFTVTGTRAALVMDAPWIVASFMGVVTGVMGGVLRDMLCNEEPVVFQSTLYATASWGGALVFIGLMQLEMAPGNAALIAGSAIFCVRLAAIRWNIGLPQFYSK